ncbi:unnamed protein product, partial [marine sediment metagenome]
AYCDWLSMMLGLPRAYNHSPWECNGGDPYGAVGYRLPTDAEWEYAAQYDDERTYPWGSEAVSCERANYREPGAGCVGSSTPVGSYPAAPASLGLYDIAGNVWEWCNDKHTCSLGSEAVSDPTGALTGTSWLLRGGAWESIPVTVRCAYRGNSTAPWHASPYSGFRCARSQ